jgi:phage terminase Nu1 subunit (DNA packaging protein)
LAAAEEWDEEQNGESIFSAQRRRAIALADAQEIANAVKRGELVELERVRVWGEGLVKTTVDLLTRIPGQTQDRHASETDPAKCGEVTMGEIQRAVDEIRKMEELWRARSK